MGFVFVAHPQLERSGDEGREGEDFPAQSWQCTACALRLTLCVLGEPLSGAAVMRALKHAPLRAARRLVAGAPLPRISDFSFQAW